jgi:hypothetical protein
MNLHFPLKIFLNYVGVRFLLFAGAYMATYTFLVSYI